MSVLRGLAQRVWHGVLGVCTCVAQMLCYMASHIWPTTRPTTRLTHTHLSPSLPMLPPLPPKNVVATKSESEDRTKIWMDIIEQTLNDQPGEGSGAGSQFVCLESLVCVGVALGVFIQAKFLPYVCDVQSSVVKVGIMGVMGNKGGCSIRFQFFRNSLCFVSSHLAAHRNNIQGRNSDFANILERMSFRAGKAVDQSESKQGGAADASSVLAAAGMGGGVALGSGGGPPPPPAGMGSSRFTSADFLALRGSCESANQMELNSAMDAGGQQGIADHDFVVWMGDLNYRIDSKLSLEECYDYIEKDDLETLRRFDQLNIERGAGRVFQNFSEARCVWEGREERECAGVG